MAGLFDTAKRYAQSEQGANVTDQVLDAVADIVSKRTDGKHDDQIAKARRLVDERLGRQRPASDGEQPDGQDGDAAR